MSKCKVICVGIVIFLSYEAAAICTTIHDSNRNAEIVTYNYWDTFVNNKAMIERLDVFSAEVTETGGLTENGSRYHTKLHQDRKNPGIKRDEFYLVRYNESTSDPNDTLRQELKLQTCAPNAEMIDSTPGNVNEVVRSDIWFGNEIGGNFKNKGSYSFSATVNPWGTDIPLCQWYFGPEELPAAVGCGPYRFESAVYSNKDDSDSKPQRETETQRLRASLSELLGSLDGDEKEQRDRNRELLQDRNYLKVIGNLDDVDLDELESLELKKFVISLRSDLSDLNDRKRQLEIAFNEVITEVEQVLDGLSSIEEFESFLNGKAFAIDLRYGDIEILDFDTIDYTDIATYRVLKNQILNELSGYLASEDYARFSIESENWINTLNQFKTVLSGESNPSSDEWIAYSQAVSDVEEYIYTYLERDFWFKDSMLTDSERASLDTLGTYSPSVSLSLAMNFRGFREGLSPSFGKDMAMISEVLAYGMSADPLAELKAVSYNNVLSELNQAVKGAAACSVVAFGDLNDLYQAVSGKHPCTGDELNAADRWIAAGSLIIGSSQFWKGVSSAPSAPVSSKAFTKSLETFEAMAESVGMTKAQRDEFIENLSYANACDTK